MSQNDKGAPCCVVSPFFFWSQLYCFQYVADVCFFSCPRIISHDRIYVEQNESMRLLMFCRPPTDSIKCQNNSVGVYVPVREQFENRSAKQNQKSREIANGNPRSWPCFFHASGVRTQSKK